MLQIFLSFLYGIIEGITEWLPISSTGHMILFDSFFTEQMGGKDLLEMFRVVIQLGAIMAVVILYFNKLNPFAKSKTPVQKSRTWRIWALVLIGCVPAAIVGLLLDDWMDANLYNMITVAITLIIYGILFIVLETMIKKGKISTRINGFGKIDYKIALFIGAFQMLALIPGTSRSGITILGAMLLGCSRSVAAEYSFFLSIPVMFGASLLKCASFGAKLVSGKTSIGGVDVAAMIVGIVTAFVVSVFAIKFLMNYIKKHDFKTFGWYRIILGVLVIIVYIFTL